MGKMLKLILECPCWQMVQDVELQNGPNTLRSTPEENSIELDIHITRKLASGNK